MFDPEKVERFSFEDGCAGCCDCTMSQNQPDGDYVDASDYDRLLQLYRVCYTQKAYQTEEQNG